MPPFLQKIRAGRSMDALIKVIVIGSLGVTTAGVLLAKRFLDAPPVEAAVAAAPSAEPTKQSEAAPSLPSGRNVLLKPDARGQFQADVTVNGRVIRMLVDTGATYVALTQNDAIALGVLPIAFNIPMRTANGEMRAGEAKLNEIRIGQIAVRDTPAVVMPSGAANQSLLGMSFLKKLAGFEFASGNLILKQ